jgi:hypothetical protein
MNLSGYNSAEPKKSSFEVPPAGVPVVLVIVNTVDGYSKGGRPQLTIELDGAGKFEGCFGKYPRKIFLQYDQGGMPQFKYNMELIKHWNPSISIADGDFDDKELRGYHVPCILTEEEYTDKTTGLPKKGLSMFAEIVDQFDGVIPPRDESKSLPF